MTAMKAASAAPFDHTMVPAYCFYVTGDLPIMPGSTFRAPFTFIDRRVPEATAAELAVIAGRTLFPNATNVRVLGFRLTQCARSLLETPPKRGGHTSRKAV
jgi:hypothetical protein